jgi:hypothetical protein
MEAPQEKIMALADARALEFLSLDAAAKDFSPARAELVTKQAIFGFRVKQEQGKAERAKGDQFLRAIRMITADPAERKAYIEATMPKMLPAK